jgi:hypothetical protein
MARLHNITSAFKTRGKPSTQTAPERNIVTPVAEMPLPASFMFIMLRDERFDTWWNGKAKNGRLEIGKERAAPPQVEEGKDIRR